MAYMEKLNCWDVLKCGRQPGGDLAEKFGVCPAAVPGEYDGMNDGECAGRFCWAISGTFCEGKVHGTYATKLKSCLNCEFLNKVHEEEGRDFRLTLKDAEKNI